MIQNMMIISTKCFDKNFYINNVVYEDFDKWVTRYYYYYSGALAIQEIRKGQY